MSTIPEIIEIAKVCQYLANYATANGALYGTVTDPMLGLKLYVIRKDVEDIYNLNPNYPGLAQTANYLYGLCGTYSLQAQAIIAGGGGGIPINPVTPGGNTGTYLIPITSADFADATNYNNPLIVGKNLAIFWNDIPRYIYSPSEWFNTLTGINITIAGFDATVNNYNLYIYIIN